MNTIKTKAFLMLTATALLAACNFDDGFRPCVRGNNTINTETRALADFNSVDYLMEGDIEIRKGERHEIMIEGNSNQMEHVRTRVSNGTLRIDSERCLKSTRFKFIVYTRDLEKAKLSGSGNMDVSDGFTPRHMSFEVAGSGKISASSVSALKVTARLSGSGRLDMEGTCQTFDIQLSGSGMIRAFALVCNTANANISGSGGIEVFVSDNLNANISGSGTIRYKGDPTVNAAISGSGKVTKVQ
ncbi:head GIN domain-containing protein [Paradesertivirga mongoliensis]|uniref:Head GIN domain-containing protein n=1 Tax=Paradesertivirga mongoliensis TaxID=2100740 RepID=A0ABW4ZKH5_9SPHI|nr:head GIN domain-containing protein [Pedobacter mongoliensis]